MSKLRPYIYTFDGKLLVDELPEWAGDSQSVIDHMNNDHQSVFPKYLKDAKLDYDNDEEKLSLLEFDQYGFHLTSGNGQYFYLNFPNMASSFSELRKQFTLLAQDS